MEYDISAFVKDFGERTRKNLDVIERISNEQQDAIEPQVYEVTQLINSLLGLLIIPQQALQAAQNTSNYNAYRFYDNGELRALIKSLQERKRLYPSNEHISEEEFIRRMRNAVAHPDRGIQFFPISNYKISNQGYIHKSKKTKKISYIYFMDRENDYEGVFCVLLSLDEVRKVAISISDSISQMLADTPYEQVIERERVLSKMQEYVQRPEEL